MPVSLIAPSLRVNVNDSERSRLRNETGAPRIPYERVPNGHRKRGQQQLVNVFVLIILLFFVVVPIGQAVAKAIETRATRPPLPKEPEQAGRLEELERQVLYLSEQVDAMVENQEFLTHLLESRPSSVPSAHSEEEGQ